ncbi:hypothetical protein HY498_05490 [Candidatus Woesearchaeota archaeon]|nr:hypothetical protein [Candidatus Woesearchaeota archaeon]
MVSLEEKISFMMSKFRDLIIKAALMLIKKKHEKECSFGSSMELSAKMIEKEPSKLETTKFEEPEIYFKKEPFQIKDLYSKKIETAEVQVSCSCGQNFTLTNKDKEFKEELDKVQHIAQQPSYETRFKAVSKEYAKTEKYNKL